MRPSSSILFAFVILCLNAIPSQSYAISSSDISSQMKSSDAAGIKHSTTPATMHTEHRSGLLLPGEVDAGKLLPNSELDVPPYGANLFAGGYETERADGLSEDYLIASGDKINIWLWGAVNLTDVVTVDNQGNIFLPDIGPIKVANTPASGINRLVTSRIKRIYTHNVNIYVNLLTATPVSVFVTGPVLRPGQYAGMAADSILYYLKRAGGIDAARGSYRHIQILRNGQLLQEIDLYDFMQTGIMPEINFKDKDVILVQHLGTSIRVEGEVKNPFRFEIKTPTTTGQALWQYAKPLAKISHVGVTGNRPNGPFSVYMPAQQFQSFTLADGDKLFFNDDLLAQVYDVQISGSYLGPSYFSVSRTTKLHDLLHYVAIDPRLSDIHSIYLLRKSVAKKQKEMIEQSLNRLERSVFTAPSSSDGEALIRGKEAEMVMRFAEKARQVQPLGKVVVSDHQLVANVLLEEGDTIVIPQKTDLVQVSGEVLMPQAVVYNAKGSVDDYIAWAGGFTQRADDQRIAIVRANGLLEFDSEDPVRPGDQVLVLPKVDSKTMQAVKDITQIIYQIAIAADVVLKN